MSKIESRSGVTEITPDLYQLKLGPVNAYLVKDGERLVLLPGVIQESFSETVYSLRELYGSSFTQTFWIGVCMAVASLIAVGFFRNVPFQRPNSSDEVPLLVSKRKS